MSWNQRGEPLSTGSAAQRRQGSLLKASVQAASASVAYLAARTNCWSWLTQAPWAAQLCAGLLGYVLTAVLLLGCLTELYAAVWRPQPQQWEKELSATQRALFGLPVPAAARPDGAAARAPPAGQKAASSPSWGPPLRHAKPITPSPRGSEGRGADATPLQPGMRRSSLSPYGAAPTVTTPEQLQPFLDAFEEQTRGAGALDGAAGREVSPGLPASLGVPFGSGELPVQQYRPSLQARGATGSPLRPDGVLGPSSQETLEAVLARLQTDAATLHVWLDRFREWLAAELLQPLLRRMDCAHREVAAAAGALGWTRVELSRLGEPEAGGGGKGLEADEEAQLNGLGEALVGQLRNALPEPQRQAGLACLQTVRQYQRLAALLRGEHPRGLLPPVPRGYIAARVRQLADGPCLAAFTWDAGGAWRGKPWTPELLTDSALVFYLFAAFLQAPRWEFPLEDAPQAGTSAPLYVGSLPSRPAQHCTALLPVRPAALPKGASAVLALGLAGREPTFTLVIGGEPALTLRSYRAAFTQLLLLAQLAKLENYGALGSNSLAYLRLQAVLRPAEPLLQILTSKWFGLW